jgi:hypothetical protein
MGIIQGTGIAGSIPRGEPYNPFEDRLYVPNTTTIQSVVDIASAGDTIYIEPGDYAETVTISTDNLTLIGTGQRGSVAVAPAGANDIAVVIDGTTSGRVEEVTLINIGGEGAGTGGGLHVKGDIRRFSAYGCKFEGGTFGLKLESTAAGAIADSRFEDCEFVWTGTGVHITASGGGDPVTQSYFRDCVFHNNTARMMLSDVSHTTGLIVKDSIFSLEEDASQPTSEFVKVDVASSEGLFAGNYFALATMAVADLAIAAGVLWVGNVTEAGVGGRPA